MAGLLLLLRRLFGRGMRGGLAALMLGLVVVGQAHASGNVPPIPPVPTWICSGAGHTTAGTFSTAAAACAQWSADLGGTGCGPAPGGNPAQFSCTNAIGSSFTVTANNIGAPTCPGNSTGPANGVCTCVTGFSPGEGALTGFCVPPTNCPSGSTVSTGWYDIGTDVTAFQSAGCVAGCGYTYDGFSASRTELVGGVKHYFAQGSYVSTGSKCGAGVGDPGNAPTPPAASAEPPASTCPPGQQLGQIDGKDYCAPVGSATAASAPASGAIEPPKDVTACTTSTAGTVTTKACTTTFADGTKGTTTTTTDAANGATTTTSTGANSSGGAGPMKPGTPASGGGGGGGGGGPCSDNPSAAGCGGAAGGTPSSYEAKDKTFSGVLTARRDEFLSSGVGAATVGFWSVTGSGVCPITTWHIPYVNAAVPFDVMCAQWALDMLDKMKVVVLLVFAWYAFRICLD